MLCVSLELCGLYERNGWDLEKARTIFYQVDPLHRALAPTFVLMVT